MDNFTRDGYYFFHVKWRGGFTHIVPVRGYNVRSNIKFTESLEWIDTYDIEQVTQEQYDLRLWGSNLEEEDGRASKNKTQQKNPTKRKPRKEGSKDSKATRNTSDKSPRVAKEKPSLVRESKVRNVRKPKEDVQGTNIPRTKTFSGSRATKRSSQ